MTVTIYTKPGCGPCTASKTAMTARGITFTAKDVTADPDALQEVERLGYRQMPVIVAGDQHWSGFRLDLIDGLAEA